jgi:endo-1,4-beta-D-glucanase Y
MGVRIGRQATAAALVLVLGVVSVTDDTYRQPVLPSGESPGALLSLTWNTYKADFITGEGRVRDRPPVGWDETTSEGQAYALLRAVWIDDRPTFDQVWAWTRDHLRPRGDSLLSWLWGPDHHGGFGVLSASSATDADEDAALALVLAGRRWNNDGYLADARQMLLDIWNKEVVRSEGTYYVAAGDWAGNSGQQVVVNPSYLAPYAYRVFAEIDRARPWRAVAASSYLVLGQCSGARLNATRSVGLPPNWCRIDTRDGAARPYAGKDADRFGFDAFRVLWRVALDYEWYRSADALAYLRQTGFLRAQWKAHRRLAAQYTHDGVPVFGEGEEPFVYAAELGYFLVVDEAAGQTILQDEVQSTLYRRGTVAYWGSRYNYYGQNWTWFGVALSRHALAGVR